MERTEKLGEGAVELVTSGHLAEFFRCYGELSPSLVRKIAASILAEPLWGAQLLQVIAGRGQAEEIPDAKAENRFLRHLWESQR